MPLAKIGRYRLAHELGVGMFSRVVVGVDDETGKQYAVKIMNKRRLEELNMDQYARREAVVLHRVRHPQIVEFVEAIQSSKKLFLVMELVPGCELLDVVKDGPLSESDAREYTRQLVDAVACLHMHNYAHRDIKPSNILIDTSARKLTVIDLGLAGVIKRYTPMLTSCGSDFYSAPETTFGSHHGYDGIKSDSWSIGVLAYIMLTGTHPFVDRQGNLMVDNLRTATLDFPVEVKSDAVSFVRCLLTLAPRKRASVAQIRAHQWLNPAQSPDMRTARGSLDMRGPVRNRSGASGTLGGFFPRASLPNGSPPNSGVEGEVQRRKSKGSTSSFLWFRKPIINDEFGEEGMDESRQSFGTAKLGRRTSNNAPEECEIRERSASIIGLTTQAISSIASGMRADRTQQSKNADSSGRKNRSSHDGSRVGRAMSSYFKRNMFMAKRAPG